MQIQFCHLDGSNGSLAKQNGHVHARPDPETCSQAKTKALFINNLLWQIIRLRRAAKEAGVPMREIPNAVWGGMADLLGEIVFMLSLPESDWLPLAQAINNAQMAHIADRDSRMHGDLMQANLHVQTLIAKITSIC